MTENESGDRYYYSRGCTRLLAKMDEQALRAIKTVAVERELSIMEVTREALEQFLSNTEVLARDFMPESNGSSLKTFIPKDLHKRVKIVATRDFGKRLGDLTGAVLSRWAKERVSEAQQTSTTQTGSGAEMLEKVAKLRAQTIPVASGPN